MMICHLPIRRLTAAERADRDEAEGMRYDTLYAQIEAEERAEYEEEFGEAYRAKNPYKPDGARIHEKVVARARAEQY